MVTYKRFDHFKQTVESLTPTLPEGSKMVIVDNNFENNYDVLDYAAIMPPHPNVRMEFMLNEKNSGWAGALNEIFNGVPFWREYEYVLETNNDVTFEPDWFEKAKAMMEAHPEIGILGLWKHPHHGIRQVLPDGLLIKDNMPATAWLFRSEFLSSILPFEVKGPCNTRGGNGEDTSVVLKTQEAGKWVCGLREDLAHHMDGYDSSDLGKPNSAYA